MTRPDTQRRCRGRPADDELEGCTCTCTGSRDSRFKRRQQQQQTGSYIAPACYWALVLLLVTLPLPQECCFAGYVSHTQRLPAHVALGLHCAAPLQALAALLQCVPVDRLLAAEVVDDSVATLGLRPQVLHPRGGHVHTQHLKARTTSS
jgi:hypothetical protein